MGFDVIIAATVIIQIRFKLMVDILKSQWATENHSDCNRAEV